MDNSVDLKCLGKLLEELGEAVAAASRCLIQGIDETEPITGKPNRLWLEEELADIQAGARIVTERFHLRKDFIEARSARKEVQLRAWHLLP